MTFESAAYIARYCVQKVSGDLAEAHYRVITDDGEIIDRTPEFNHMSLKPGIGRPWLDKWQSDVYPRDYVIVNGTKVKPPKYYDILFERENPGAFSEIVAQRELDGYQQQLIGENSDARLRVKEIVVSARADMLKRNLSC